MGFVPLQHDLTHRDGKGGRVVKRVLKTLSSASGRRVGILLARVNLKRYRRFTDTVLEEYPVRPSRVA